MENNQVDRCETEKQEEVEDDNSVVCCEPSGSISTKKQYLVDTMVTDAGEDDTQVYIEAEDISTLPKRPLIRAICALKNTGKHSKIFIGVKKNGMVSGVRMDRGEVGGT